MPSVIVGNPALSGAQIVVSGFPWSGQIRPVGGVQLRWSSTASGNCFIGLSGGTTVTSGGMFLSGGGLLDGMLLTPGDGYWVPRIGTGLSGNLTIYAQCEPAASGQGRLFYEVY
jgi:hypothetical protein